ncbi:MULTISPECIES: phosphonopyruvate decarboxylase [Rhizobium]|uniref:Phosphonopyruvate decarboxylase n=1 Tax=Rhizobium leguminosarum TaxID=384 RepID=A0A2Z4YQZ4_RHILE|nr:MULTISPECIES: phosphonopyruvate decarboxylase [Rhizobium]AXA43691.1 phosphonopyruvate decarboxylase [Rhizobium leguminosarum]MBA9036820.1 phosphonopyruvate decarboxylase [Rhizobium leguminosarum]TBB57977.1 phosphonopyruvate decarboxylase [Rhizobium ruizarguesonis]TBF43780.1 phosphonopyruvate decarboxylase [Rhizobium leguminosarum]TBF85873.1 phosphonopyruvate decarboxylase [Rhizobium leguminosarum]
MFKPRIFTTKMATRGYNFATGVPCSLLGPLINEFTLDERWASFAAPNEGLAVGLAVGAYIGEQKPLVYMQNSGLGNALDGLTSLASIQKVPLLLVVSWRGEPGTNDEPQHDQMGLILPDILQLLGISSGFLATDGGNVDALLDDAAHEYAQRRSFAIIVKEKTFEAQPLSVSRISSRARGVSHSSGRGGASASPSRISVIDLVQNAAPQTAGIVTSTGKMSRELMMIADGPRNLYVIGSMGLASTVGLGISLFTERKVIILDGDGSVLMQMGALAMIGTYAGANFIHVILDNGVHESTGGQETVARNVSFSAVSVDCGFSQAFESCGLADFEEAFRQALLQQQGPVAIHAHVASGSAANLPRPKASPMENLERFRAHFQLG